MCEPTDSGRSRWALRRSGRCHSVPATLVRLASGAVRSRGPPVPGRSVGAPFPSPAYPLILPRTASPREPLAGLPRAGGAVDMPTHRPAAPRTSPLKRSRSLSGSLCALFSDADSASGMKAELSPRPGVSGGGPSQAACRALLRRLYQLHSAPTSIRVALDFSAKPGDFRVFIAPTGCDSVPGCDFDPCGVRVREVWRLPSGYLVSVPPC